MEPPTHRLRTMSPAEVMRLHPHPVAALLRTQGWNDADRCPWNDEGDDDWSADGWSPTWRVIRAQMETRGMLVTIREASVEEGTGFIAIWVEAEEATPADSSGARVQPSYLDRQAAQLLQPRHRAQCVGTHQRPLGREVPTAPRQAYERHS